MKEINPIDLKNLAVIRKSVRDLLILASKYDKLGMRVLDIAPQDYAGAKEFFINSLVETLDINPHSKATYIADLCETNSDKIKDETFDFVICTEVLEHTLNPFNAANEIYRILKKGGLCFISTPFNFRIHGPLPDCWRFTEHGLKALFKNFSSIEIIPVEDNDRFLMPIHYKTILKK